ncbi:metal ABC transporter substrate-binding protein [Clostridium malenominatum]|uniref:Metal ABC transporter substrate-binding protein n=1 Tax=Clostridium malenominatum TaxID=1539 RepID=A0ABN1ING1_9CLOT
MKKRILTGFIIIFLFSLMGCESKKVSTEKNDSSKINVVVTFNPLRELAEYIGGEKINISTIIPDGTEAHDFELKAKDLANIKNSNIFIYNGFDMENWVDKILDTMDGKTIVVEASKGAEPIMVVESEHHEDEDDHNHGQYDPHTWLGVTTALVQANNIKDALIKADSANKEYYEENFQKFKKDADALLSEYREKFDSLKNKSFVTSHAAFGYFCRDFGLKQNSVEGVFAEGEPTPKKMAELIDYCKKNNIRAIFVEENISTKVSETLAKEVGAEVKVIHTLESKGDKNYIESMRENLEIVYENLK